MPDEGAEVGLARPVRVAGAPLDRAAAAMLMIHGRGAGAADILSYVPRLDWPHFAYLAPEAPDHTWYPHPFTAPLADNEPFLTASLTLISDLFDYLDRAGISAGRVVLFGFSQGACLALEYAARHTRRYGAVVGLSGGLIGPDSLSRADGGSFDGTPIFLGCSDVDPHIPKHRVEHAASVLQQMGGAVRVRLYPNMEHTVNDDELKVVRGLMAGVVAG